MTIEQQIENHLASHANGKQEELRTLHNMIIQLFSGCKLWFMDGKNEDGKTVTNPNIGYGEYTFNYANGTTRDFYKIGFSANTTGISVNIMGLTDKKYLVNNYSKRIGKAKVSSYCIHFKTLHDLDLDVLNEALIYGFNN